MDALSGNRPVLGDRRPPGTRVGRVSQPGELEIAMASVPGNLRKLTVDVLVNDSGANRVISLIVVIPRVVRHL
jgi:hypothetical protein